MLPLNARCGIQRSHRGIPFEHLELWMTRFKNSKSERCIHGNIVLMASV
jgi:hypothetical protein